MIVRLAKRLQQVPDSAGRIAPHFFSWSKSKPVFHTDQILVPDGIGQAATITRVNRITSPNDCTCPHLQVNDIGAADVIADSFWTDPDGLESAQYPPANKFHDRS